MSTMPLPNLNPEVIGFPAVEHALPNPNGLLAVGGDVTPKWLLHAYYRGIFPWYEEGQPIIWWAPDPRMVLIPGRMYVSRSLRRLARRSRYQLSVDRCFAQVMDACALPRRPIPPDCPRPGTWITQDLKQGFEHLHRMGYAHSVETWQDGQLIGGIYGLAIGRVFFGESMFSRKPDASKLALWFLQQQLAALGYGLIDCQVASEHLHSLGAREIPRPRFQQALAQLMGPTIRPGPWLRANHNSQS